MRLIIAAAGRWKAGNKAAPERALYDYYAGRIRFPLELREIEEKKKLKPNALKKREAELLLAQALDEVSQQRGTRHDIVNAAYTSQMDSITGRLEGERRGDKFYRANGDVIQADVNAARNVLARLDDPDITRYMPHGEVKRILLGRFSGATERQEARVVCQHGMSTGCG